MHQRINEEASSFASLINKYTEKDKDERVCTKVATVPIYTVNRSTGAIRKAHNADIFTQEYSANGAFCQIYIVGVGTFQVQPDSKFDNKVIDTTKDGFISGNCNLFLCQKDAACFAKNVLLKKRKKLDEQIKKMEMLCI